MKTKSKKAEAKPKKRRESKLAAAVHALKKRMILEALKKHRDIDKAAKDLEISSGTFRMLLHQYGIRFKTKVTRTVEFDIAKQ